MIEGESGIGKTTFVNAFRYQWGYRTKDKLISPFNAIQVQENWRPKEFLLSSVYHTISRIRFDIGEDEFNKNEILKEIASAVAAYREEHLGFGFGVQNPIAGISAQRQVSVSTTVGSVTSDLLFSYLGLLIQMVKSNGYQGLILHYDNLETVEPNVLLNLIDAVRDYLQIQDVYFVFVGGIGTFRKSIFPKQRVKSIFVSNPVIVNALSLETVHQIIRRRCEVCALAKNWILPVETELIDTLYTFFEGKLRPIMNEIVNLVSDREGSHGPITKNQALSSLKQIKLETLDNININNSIKEVFIEATKVRKFTASQLAKLIGKSRQYVSDKCIGPLVENNLIKPAEKEGRSQYFEVESDYLIIGIENMST